MAEKMGKGFGKGLPGVDNSNPGPFTLLDQSFLKYILKYVL